MSVGRMYGDERIASCLKSVHNVSERTTVLWTSAATPIDKLDEVINLFLIILHLYNIT